jgi:hypothetical protein
MEICLDCKDKVVKFYHFKRKAKEVQKRQKSTTEKTLNQPKDKTSKVVHDIVAIVQNYTEKCSISTIKIDESNDKLIIEPSRPVESLPETSSASVISIKDEPESESEENLWESYQIEDSSDEPQFSDIFVKEEPAEYQPMGLNSLYQYVRGPRRSARNSIVVDVDSNQTISKAAAKMRKYRERLKQPENLDKFLFHKEQQREWNRRHYLKKQITSGKPVRFRQSSSMSDDNVNDPFQLPSLYFDDIIARQSNTNKFISP